MSCFEVALRNAIDAKLTPLLGNEWLKESVMPGGVFDNRNTVKTKDIILHAYNRLRSAGRYSHSKLMAEMEFGIWNICSPRPV